MSKNVCGRCVVKNAAPTFWSSFNNQRSIFNNQPSPPPDLKDLSDLKDFKDLISLQDFKDLISLLIPSHLIRSHADVEVVDAVSCGFLGDNHIVDGVNVVRQVHQVLAE